MIYYTWSLNFKLVYLRITLKIYSWFYRHSICEIHHRNLYQHTCSQREDCNQQVLEFDQLGWHHTCTQNCQFDFVSHRFDFELNNLYDKLYNLNMSKGDRLSQIARQYLLDVIIKHLKCFIKHTYVLQLAPLFHLFFYRVHQRGFSSPNPLR